MEAIWSEYHQARVSIIDTYVWLGNVFWFRCSKHISFYCVDDNGEFHCNIKGYIWHRTRPALKPASIHAAEIKKWRKQVRRGVVWIKRYEVPSCPFYYSVTEQRYITARRADNNGLTQVMLDGIELPVIGRSRSVGFDSKHILYAIIIGPSRYTLHRWNGVEWEFICNTIGVRITVSGSNLVYGSGNTTVVDVRDCFSKSEYHVLSLVYQCSRFLHILGINRRWKRILPIELWVSLQL